MKRWLNGGLLGVVMAVGGQAAEEAFSKALRAEDYAAAGLSRLSAEEIARLDALVRDFKSGALERAKREAAAAEARAAKAEAKAAAVASAAAREKDKAGDSVSGSGGGSLLNRAKVLLTPGTEIEYSTVESRIAGEFRGWEGRTTFALENGQRWQSVPGGSTYVAARPVTNPAVKITPGALGSFWMSVEGVKPRVKVVLLGGK